MAVYKVAQDVEADDKLIGPFTFRQFIYLIIVALAGALAWGLSRVFVGLAIIPLPIILFFGALALPLRKDQPMEVYLAAIVSFYVKPRRRLWEPDGIESLVEITAPKVVEIQRTKTLSEDETERRLSFLADIADTRGWSVRHVAAPPPQTSMTTDVYYAAQQTEDVLDASGGISQSLGTMMDQADVKRREEMIARMHATAAAPVAPNIPAPTPVSAPIPQVAVAPDPQVLPVAPPTVVTPPVIQSPAAPTYNPYPTEIHQAMIQPLSAQPQPAEQQVTTSETPVSPDIINLANNPDLSIETIQREANRIQEKADRADDEVFVSLR